MIGFHASHEQIDPSALLTAVKRAEEVGFTAMMCSDPFAPWNIDRGEAGFAWSWLGAALEATRVSFGVLTAPGPRYHPAVLAQAIGTLGQMYPGRFWATLGPGANGTGQRPPSEPAQPDRLEESVRVMRALLAGEEVSTTGPNTMERARVWSRPDTPPPLLATAMTADTAGWAAGWADGLVTVAQPADTLRRVLDAYDAGGGMGRRSVRVHLSWASTDEEALAIARDQWGDAVAGGPHVAGEPHGSVLISSDLGWHAARIAELVELGFDDIYLHHVGVRQQEFLDAFGDQVLPHFHGQAEVA